MSKTLSRLQQAQEERGQREARAVTCGQPHSHGTLHSAARSGVPCRLWVGAHRPACHPPPTQAGSVDSSVSGPPLSSSRAAGSTPARPRRLSQQRSLRASHPRQFTSAPIHPPAHPAPTPGALAVFHHTTLSLGLLGEQQVPARVAASPRPRRKGEGATRGHAALVRGPVAAFTATAEPEGSQACSEDVPNWGKSGLQKK